MTRPRTSTASRLAFSPSPLAARRGLAAALFGLVFALLSIGHRQVGYVRDEGMYFEASRHYARWVAEVVAQPSRLGDRRLRDKRFAINHEHPAGMKIVGGLAASWLSDAPGVRQPLLPEGAAMRLPAQALAALGAAILFLAASRRYGLLAGLLATGLVFTLPRVWFHAGLHTFDVPIMVATLIVALTYVRALSSRRWGLLLGPTLGVAIAIKHNALFLAPLLTLHLFATVWRARRREGQRPPRSAYIALPLWSMAGLAPMTAFALWPWLWTAPYPRLRDYLTFHAQHNWYNMEFLGRNYNQPPMPFAYPWVMTWATVPTCLLLLALLGLAMSLLHHRREPAPRETSRAVWAAPLHGHDPCEGLLWLLLALFPFVLIAWPTTPIFGGTKHWLTAYPFLALAAAHAWARIWRSRPSLPRTLEVGALGLVLLPSTLSTVHGHPWNLSQYAPMIGGARGAAYAGLNRGFWGYAALPHLERVDPAQDSPLCLGDLHPLVQRQYEREGRWPQGVTEGRSLSRCRAGLHFYEKHTLTEELALWNRFGTAAPRAVLSLDDVPLSSVYGPAP